MIRRGLRLTPFQTALLLAVALSALRFSGCAVFEVLDTRAIDLRLRYRGPISPADEIAIVAVDDASIARIGRWPWPRSTVARLVDAISAAGPAVIGFDVVQAEDSVAPVFRALRDRVDDVDAATWSRVESALRQWNEEDENLAAAIRRADNVVLGYYFDPRNRTATDFVPTPYTAIRGVGESLDLGPIPEMHGAVANLPVFADAARATGFFNVFPDARDGIFRRAPLALRHGNTVALPLSIAMLRVYWNDAPAVLSVAPFGVESARIGQHEVELAEDGRMLINFRGPRRTFRHVSAADVLEGRVNPDRLRGKLALVGVTAAAVADVRATPFDGTFPGVEIHATVIDNVLREDYLQKPDFFVTLEIAFVLVAALALGWTLQHARGISGAAAAAAVVVGYLGGSQALFESSGLALGLIFPLGSIGLIYFVVSIEQFAAERGEKKQIRDAFSLYVAPEVVRHVSDSSILLGLGGEKRKLTVLFSDIRGFTSLSERVRPDQLVEMVNEYLGAMTTILFAHQGTLDKYIGDSVMAFWGAPLPCEAQAERACTAAIAMVERTRTLADEWEHRGWPRIEIGVGIHTGEMVVGNFGSEKRLTYTAIGDGVNLASRLEGLTKRYGARIIASESTIREAGDAIVAREVDQVRVRGRHEPTHIYEVLGSSSERERWSLSIERFARGLDAYRSRRWTDAREAFESVLALDPSDATARLYISRCEVYPVKEPGPTWDAVSAAD